MEAIITMVLVGMAFAGGCIFTIGVFTAGGQMQSRPVLLLIGLKVRPVQPKAVELHVGKRVTVPGTERVTVENRISSSSNDHFFPGKGAYIQEGGTVLILGYCLDRGLVHLEYSAPFWAEPKGEWCPTGARFFLPYSRLHMEGSYLILSPAPQPQEMETYHCG